MMTKFTDSQLSYFAHLRSRQIIVLVSVQPEFAELLRFLCSVSWFWIDTIKHASAFEIIS